MNDNIIEHLPDSNKFLDERTTSRIIFLRKLYALLAVQFAVALLTLNFVLNDEDSYDWVQSHKGLGIGFCIFQLVLAVIIYFKRSAFRRLPLNVLVYILFTALLAYNVVFLSDSRRVVTMFIASILVLCISLLFYALTTRLDLTFLGGTIYILGSALFSYLGLLITTDVEFFVLIFLAMGIVILGFYLIYDTKFIIVGQSLSSQMEDPFVGSIVIYLDMFFIAFRLVESLGKLFKRNRF